MCFRYKEGKYPENMEKLTILNTSPLDADISFCFQVDSKAETFLLEPPIMQLKPGQQEVRYHTAQTRTAGGKIHAAQTPDSKAETFLLEPPTMQLKPGQQEVDLSEIEDRRAFASGGSVPALFSIP